MMSQGPSESTAVAMGLALGGLRGHRPLDSAFLRSWVGDRSPQGWGQRALNPQGQDEMRSERRERLQGSVGHGMGLRVPRKSSRGQRSSSAGDLLCAGHWGCHTGQKSLPSQSPQHTVIRPGETLGVGTGADGGGHKPQGFPNKRMAPKDYLWLRPPLLSVPASKASLQLSKHTPPCAQTSLCPHGHPGETPPRLSAAPGAKSHLPPASAMPSPGLQAHFLLFPPRPDPTAKPNPSPGPERCHAPPAQASLRHEPSERAAPLTPRKPHSWPSPQYLLKATPSSDPSRGTGRGHMLCPHAALVHVLAGVRPGSSVRSGFSAALPITRGRGHVRLTRGHVRLTRRRQPSSPPAPPV